jgi:hypothetical protein
MPLLPGEPLSARIEREGRLPEQTAARWACQIARALAVAHAAGVVHRDLKPANVMLTRGASCQLATSPEDRQAGSLPHDEAGDPIVMDFGLARRSGPDDPRLTAAGALVGTPAYSAPEQLGGRPEAMGPACDVYSLGVILYEMLTGRLPFDGSLDEVILQVLSRDPPPPSRHRPDLDPRLEAACLTAMAKDPAARFPSMDAFAAALDGYLRGEDPPTVAPSGRHGARTGSRVPRLLLAGAGAALAALLAWAAWARLRGPADALPAGSHWVGTYHFTRPAGAGSGDVQLAVSERDGEAFRGVYSTLGGKYEWQVEGTLRGRRVRWQLTRVIRPPNATAGAVVEGTCEGGTIRATYRDHDSEADMRLVLEK